MARGTFKQKRGGGRNFSKHLVLDENGIAEDKWASRGQKDSDDDDDSEESESEESEESEDEAPSGSIAQQPELSRTERRELKKKKAQAKQPQGVQEEDEDDPNQDPLVANTNLSLAKKMNISDLSAPRELTRRERDAKAQKEAKEKYWKLHEQGKTDQAKADLARLTKIRAEREAAQAKRKAETEARTAEVEAKRKEATAKGKRL